MHGNDLWPLVLYGALVALVAGGMVGVSALLGERHRDRETGEPYESGIVSTGSARIRFSSRFYLVAMFFVVFDLESVFLYAWAVSARRVGWAGFAEATVFVAVLLAALFYLWRLGALSFGPAARLDTRTKGKL
jgi:NADH-quinone oxidoreductase subunit A